ncbi:MAG: GAP family protein [Thermomicrobiales bacterium]
MIETLVLLLPATLAAAIVPGWILLMLMLLEQERALPIAGAFLGGVIVSRLAQGIILTWFASSLPTSTPHADTTVRGVVEAIIGLGLLGTAAHALSRTPDPDTSPPAWLHRLEAISPPLAFVAGMFLVLVGSRQWLFAFGAVQTIQGHMASPARELAGYVLFVIGASLPLIVPFLWQAGGTEAGRKRVQSANGWLARHGQRIAAALSIVLGVYFLGRGVTSIWG